MRVAVINHALPIFKKNRIASLLCIFETKIPGISNTLREKYLGLYTNVLYYSANHVYRRRPGPGHVLN